MKIAGCSIPITELFYEWRDLTSTNVDLSAVEQEAKNKVLVEMAWTKWLHDYT